MEKITQLKNHLAYFRQALYDYVEPKATTYEDTLTTSPIVQAGTTHAANLAHRTFPVPDDVTDQGRLLSRGYDDATYEVTHDIQCQNFDHERREALINRDGMNRQ